MKKVEINDPLAKAAYSKLLSTKKTTLCNKGISCKEVSCKRAHPPKWDPNYVATKPSGDNNTTKKVAPIDELSISTATLKVAPSTKSKIPPEVMATIGCTKKKCKPIPAKDCLYKH